MFFSNSLIFFIASFANEQHRGFATTSLATMRPIIALLALSCLALPAIAASPQATLATPNMQAARPGWLDLQAGRATLQQAEQVWQRASGQILARYYGNALDSFRNQGGLAVNNLSVIVVEVAGLEGLDSARFAFFDGVLFRTEARLQAGLTMSDAIQRLSKRYGQPASVSGTPLRQAYWQSGDAWVSLQADTEGKLSLLLNHQGLARQVRTSNMEVYAAYVLARPPSRPAPLP